MDVRAKQWWQFMMQRDVLNYRKIEQGYILRREFSLSSWNSALLSTTTESFRRTCVHKLQGSTGHTELRKEFWIITWEKMYTFPFFPGFLPAAVGDIKINWLLGKGGTVGWIRCSFPLEYSFILGLAVIFVYWMKFLLPDLQLQMRAPPCPFPPSVCVESVPARVNAQHRLQAAHETKWVWKMGPGGLGIKCFSALLQTNLQQLIRYGFAQHTLCFKSSSRYESIDYWQTNHPKFIWHFKGFL